MDFGLIKHKIKKHKLIFLIAFFAIYMFEYMVTLTFIDQRNIGVSNSSWQLALHYLDYVLVAAGFVSFALLRKIFKGEKGRIRLLVIPNLVYFISVIVLCFMHSVIGYSIMAMLAAFSLGILGGIPVWGPRRMRPAQIFFDKSPYLTELTVFVNIPRKSLYFVQRFLVLRVKIKSKINVKSTKRLSTCIKNKLFSSIKQLIISKGMANYPILKFYGTIIS